MAEKSKPVKWIVLGVVLLLIAGIAAGVVLARSEVIDLGWFKPEVDKGHPKLDSALNQLVVVCEAEGISEARAFARQSGIDMKDDRVRVVIEAEPGQEEEVITLAKALGADVETSYGNLVQAVVSIAHLKALADDANITLVRLPSKPMPMITPTD